MQSNITLGGDQLARRGRRGSTISGSTISGGRQEERISRMQKQRGGD
ncbi:MAG: hypothetical protein N2C14_19035 [Planctomycetales bacterium]